MINILVFGDSNSWGFVDEDEGQRYDKRWPLILADHLNQSGLSCNLHEDSLPGRTTNVNDERDGTHLNGISVFKSSLLAHSPIDIILLMLGTNDLKKRFGREADDVARGIEELITISQNTFSGKGSWHDKNISKVIILCPPTLGSKSNDIEWFNHKEWEGGFNKSKLLSNSYQKVCLQRKVQFIDSNSIIQSSGKDPIHWSKETHHIFGKEIAKILLKDIKP